MPRETTLLTRAPDRSRSASPHAGQLRHAPKARARGRLASGGLPPAAGAPLQAFPASRARRFEPARCAQVLCVYTWCLSFCVSVDHLQASRVQPSLVRADMSFTAKQHFHCGPPKPSHPEVTGRGPPVSFTPPQKRGHEMELRICNSLKRVRPPRQPWGISLATPCWRTARARAGARARRRARSGPPTPAVSQLSL